MADGSDVERTLADLDALLGRLEQLPGPAGELALEAVSALAEVYGAALARAVAIAVRQGSGSAAALTADPLLGSLLALHGIHPDAVEVRVARALDDLPGIELLGITDGVADVRLEAHGGCGCGSSPGEEEVRDAVLAAAPELAGVRTVAAPAVRAPAFVPLASLHRVPVTVPGGP